MMDRLIVLRTLPALLHRGGVLNDLLQPRVSAQEAISERQSILARIGTAAQALCVPLRDRPSRPALQNVDLRLRGGFFGIDLHCTLLLFKDSSLPFSV